MAIDLHIRTHPPLTLITRDQQMSENHRRRTPRYSYLDPTSPQRAPTPNQVTEPVTARAPPPATEVPDPRRIVYPPLFGQTMPVGQPPPGIQSILLCFLGQALLSARLNTWGT
jgi:hypothetical protein